MSRAFDNAAETERVRKNQDRNARRYDRQIAFFERVLFGDGRRWVGQQAHGQVLELAVGTARNLPYYPDDVTLTGIELSPEMLALGRRRAQELGRPAELQLGDAQALDFADESFDTVVCTLGLCTIPDPRAAVAEAGRVLRPGGRCRRRVRALARAPARATGRPLRRRPPHARAPRLPARPGLRDRAGRTIETGNRRARQRPQACQRIRRRVQMRRIDSEAANVHAVDAAWTSEASTVVHSDNRKTR